MIEALADRLEANFVFPEVAGDYARRLRTQFDTGDALSGDDREFANAVMQELRAVHQDAELRVRPPSGDAQLAEPASATSEGKAIEAKMRLSPKVAYIRFGHLAGDGAAVAELNTFLQANANVGALIVDARGMNGRGLQEVDALLADLFPVETPLVRIDVRAAADEAGLTTLRDGPRLKKIDGPQGVVRREHRAVPSARPRLGQSKLYVLVSPATAAVGEYLAQAIRLSGRGTLIGQATRGVSHAAATFDLPGGFEADIPVARAFDPSTGEDWEGLGIEPHTVIPSRDALVMALVDLGMRSKDAELLNAKLAYEPPQ